MSSIVLELQREILNYDCDILNMLRKAHLIAVKLNLQELDAWIQHELNGYAYNDPDAIPEYRQVKGVLKAFNPYNGWIPAQCPDDEIEKMICELRLWQAIGELQELYAQSEQQGVIILQFPAGKMEAIASIFNTPVPLQYALHISVHLLKNIIEQVKNCLLEWTIKLELAGILGENMQFSQEERTMAQNVPQQVNYYGTVINGDVKQSQVVSGNHNTISFNYEQVGELLEKVKEAIKSEQLSREDRETAEELIEDAEAKIASKKKSEIIKAALTGLKDFLIGAGANVAGTLIVQYLQHLL